MTSSEVTHLADPKETPPPEIAWRAQLVIYGPDGYEDVPLGVSGKSRLDVLDKFFKDIEKRRKDAERRRRQR